jgi:hypothetical protein
MGWSHLKMLAKTTSVLALLATLLTGCRESVEVALFHANGEEFSDEFLDKVENTLAGFFQMSFTAYQIDEAVGVYGAINIEIVDTDDIYGGRAYPSRPCLRHARSTTNLYIISHEVGHLFGLTHVDDPHNLMHPITGNRFKTDDDLTSSQLRKARRSAGLLVSCR